MYTKETKRIDSAANHALAATMYERRGKWATAADHWRKAGCLLNATRCEQMRRK